MTEKVDFLLYFRKKVFQKHIFVWFSLSLALLFWVELVLLWCFGCCLLRAQYRVCRGRKFCLLRRFVSLNRRNRECSLLFSLVELCFSLAYPYLYDWGRLGTGARLENPK